MLEMRCERSSNGAWTAADVEEGVQLATSGGVMGNDGFIKSGMVASAILRIVGALGRSKICKCLFSDGRERRHSDGQWEVLSVLQCTFDVKGGF